MRTLLIEDDQLLADGLSRALRQSGYVVDHAPDGKTAVQLIDASSYDLTILDLGLPDLDGSSLLNRLRQHTPHMPVLVVSARQAIEERVRLLDLGADDYLVKPVALPELEARVRALIRRGNANHDPVIRLGKLALDTIGKRAWLGEQALDLTAREWAALEFLSARLNRIISKDQIMQALYEWEEEITPNAIEKFISRLRSKLEPAGLTIRTVRGLGYYMEKPDDGV